MIVNNINKDYASLLLAVFKKYFRKDLRDRMIECDIESPIILNVRKIDPIIDPLYQAYYKYGIEYFFSYKNIFYGGAMLMSVNDNVEEIIEEIQKLDLNLHN